MIKMDSVDGLHALREIDCKGIAKELERSRKSCWHRWQHKLLPILKTHFLGLPQNTEWRKDVMVYISDNKIERVEDVDYNQWVKDVCPGQTTSSLRLFIHSIRRATVNGKTVRCNEPLNVLSSKRLSDPAPQSFSRSETLVKKQLDYAHNIVKAYEDLKAAKDSHN